MTNDDLQRLFERHGIHDLDTRAEVQQFAQMDERDRDVWVFLSMREMKSEIAGIKRSPVKDALKGLGVFAGGAAAGFLGFHGVGK